MNLTHLCHLDEFGRQFKPDINYGTAGQISLEPNSSFMTHCLHSMLGDFAHRNGPLAVGSLPEKSHQKFQWVATPLDR